jgi:hypothetical protein
MFLVLRLLLLQIESTTHNSTKRARTPTPAPILVARGHLPMFVVTVVWLVVGEADVGLVSVGLLAPVAAALFEPLAVAVGAGVATAIPI